MAYIDGNEVLFSAEITGTLIDVVQETGESESVVMSQKATTDALAEKVTVQRFAQGKNRMYCARANNPSSYYEMDSKPYIDCIPVYTDIESEITPHTSKWGQATIIVVDPKYPYQSANKRYVDAKTIALEQGIYNALGVTYTIYEDTSAEPATDVPTGVLPYAYVESLGKVVIHYDDGTTKEGIQITELMLFSEETTETYQNPTDQMYIELPNGCYSLMYNFVLTTEESEGLSYIEIEGKKIVYQVKVGA